VIVVTTAYNVSLRWQFGILPPGSATGVNSECLSGLDLSGQRIPVLGTYGRDTLDVHR
jgi:hypothetical protein